MKIWRSSLPLGPHVSLLHLFSSSLHLCERPAVHRQSGIGVSTVVFFTSPTEAHNKALVHTQRHTFVRSHCCFLSWAQISARLTAASMSHTYASCLKSSWMSRIPRINLPCCKIESQLMRIEIANEQDGWNRAHLFKSQLFRSQIELRTHVNRALKSASTGAV